MVVVDELTMLRSMVVRKRAILVCSFFPMLGTGMSSTWPGTPGIPGLPGIPMRPSRP
ncbi:unnamed protein product [Protopolystoma xenopodis]|uniref:Uncharacterized protein n=1 Tax=Protopolystoma xenopodis TaxID=117903 RepID=A0A3S5CHU4_9PLAT|nr:unnamed protein product [Protopolystoma xenopodis]